MDGELLSEVILYVYYTAGVWLNPTFSVVSSVRMELYV